MENDVMRLHQLLREGCCCSSAIVKLGLELKGQKNLQLVQAVSGLCRGLYSGLVCGALTGAVCMVNIVDPENANAEIVPELVEWFRNACEEEYGGIDCRDILRDDPANRAARCPALIEKTYLQAKQLLSDYGRELY